jgi:HK97 family phage major capsid protein
MDLNEELKSTIQEIGRRFEEFKSENDRQIKTAVRDALAEAKLEKLGQAIDDLTGKKEDLEKRIKAESELREELERKVNAQRFGASHTDDVEQKALADFNTEVKSIALSRGVVLPSEATIDEFRAYKSAFDKWMRKSRDGMTNDEIKAMQVGVDADGGYLVPSDTSGRIVKRIYELSPVRSLFGVQTISSDRLEGITDLGEAGSGWVGETATRNDTNTPQIGKYEIVAFEQYAQPKVTQKMLDDSSVDVEAWLDGKVSDKFARDEAGAFLSGDGVSKPRGLLTYATAATADATRAWGTFEHVVTGANGAFLAAANGPFDCLMDLEAAFKPAHLANAAFLTRRQVVTAMRKIKDSTYQYIWQPSLQAGKPNTLLGYPIYMSEDMPALATGSLSLAFGNFSAAYLIVDRLGVRTLRDPFTDKPYIKFYTIRRVGGAAVDFEAVKFLKFST